MSAQKWKERHDNEMDNTRIITTYAPRVHEGPALVALIKAWRLYADAVDIKDECKIGEDGVLGSHWLDIAKAIQGLLNGERGGLDAGECLRYMQSICEQNGTSLYD